MDDPCAVSLGRFPVLVLAVLVLLVAAWTSPSAAASEETPAGQWPLQPRPEVAQRFDPPTEDWGAGHRGVDLSGHVGQPVRASMAGTVTFAGPIAGKPVVTVTHGDARTTYEPVSASVRKGDTVAASEVIGHLTLPFSHCFPESCLHWGWLRGDTYLDPLLLVGERGPVRLLPLWRREPVSDSRTQSSELSAPVDRWRSPLAGWIARWWLPLTGVPPMTGSLRLVDGPGGRPVGGDRW